MGRSGGRRAAHPVPGPRRRGGQRNAGFAFYSYVAAQSDDAAVLATAECLAGKALDHAATLRGERRRACRREGARHARDGRPILDASSLPEFARQSLRLESRAAAIHRRIAARLAFGRECRLQDDRRGCRAGARAGLKPPTELSKQREQALHELPSPCRFCAPRSPRSNGCTRPISISPTTRDEQVLAAAQQAADRTMQSLAAIALG